MSHNQVQDYVKLIKMASDKIAKLEAELDDVKSKNKSKSEPIAIIGMGCRFPGDANTPEQFWNLLDHGLDAITEVPPERWNIDDYYDPDPETPGKIHTRNGGFLHRVDLFDPQFFGISPREALSLDPQHRLLLEVSWSALEHSGISPQNLENSQTGIFLGVTPSEYARLALDSNLDERIDIYDGTGNGLSFASGRLSYILGLQGPNIAIDTACSSSLVAVHLACQSLRTTESNLAIAGGVNLNLFPESTISLAKALAPEGRCKTFDASADGFSRSEGCGVVILKRLSDALADGDRIWALIRGSAVNHDGPSSGLTVPNQIAQEKLIAQALNNAKVNPAQVSYVEAHGTGTSLGDPIEVGALTSVLCADRSSSNPLVIGSVKTNFGHLEAAAGIAGLIKVVLSLNHEKIPSHLHFSRPNPYIEWDKFPLVVPTSAMPWSCSEKSRIAGVSSFGMSGTNAHVILEEAPIQVKNQESQVKDSDLGERPWHILTLSAKCEQALQELAQRYEEFLGNNSTSASIADVCFTANTGRSHFNHRLAIITSDQQELAAKLAKISRGEEANGVFLGKLSSNSSSPKIAFLFTGQGSQYVNMGRQLYETQPLFRRTLDQCDRLLVPYLEHNLLEILYPQQSKIQNLKSKIHQTAYTQPALFAIEYALAQLWESWGIKPDGVMGHSVGEYVAAAIAGVFSLEDGLKLIAHRGRLMQQLPHGGDMVAVMASESKVNQLIAPYTEKVSIAAINGSESIVISGAAEAVGTVKGILEAEGIKTKQLQVSHAFHSPLMEPMLANFEAVAKQITYHQPRIPVISNVTGTRVEESIATASYWTRHVRQPVKFAPSMETLHQEGYEVFLEIGPKPILLGMGRQCLPADLGVWLPSLRPTTKQAPEFIGSNNPKSKIQNPKSDDWQQMLQSLAELYVRGVKVDWSGFDRDYARQKVVLPTYPWQRQRYWIETSELSYQKGKALYETQEVPQTDFPFHIFCLSASSEQELSRLAKRTVSTLKKHSEIELSDICFLANTKQSHSEYRLAVVAESRIELQRSLNDFLAGQQLPNLVFANTEKASPRIVFLFSGHSCQYAGMGRELYETQPNFRKAFDDCDKILDSYLDKSLYELLYSTEAEKYFRLEEYESLPALFVIQYALVQLWKSWGVEPALVLGSSVGEYAAACSAGVFSLEDGLKLITSYGRLMQTLPPINKTIGVMTSEEKVAQIIQPYANEISIISYGGSSNLITGPSSSVQALINDLEQKGIRTVDMPGDPYGGHTNRVESILEELSQIAGEVTYSSPQVDFLSNITGEKVTAQVATPEYWLNNMRQPVKLSTAFDTLFQLDYRVFVEIGSQAIALGIGRQCFPKKKGVWLPSLRKRRSDWKQMLLSLGELYVRGVSVNWQGFYQCYPQRQVSLSKNIFAENSEETPILKSLSKGKIEQVNQLLQATGELSDTEKVLAPKLLKLLFQQHQKQLNSEQNVEDWFYELVWKPLPLNPDRLSQNNLENTSQHWLIFADSSQIGATLAQSLQKEGHLCTLIYPDRNYSDSDPEARVYGVKPDDAEDFQRLCQEIKDDSPSSVTGIIHLWCLNTEFAEELTPSTLEKAKILGCGSLLHLLQALTPIINSHMPKLWLITKGCQNVKADSNKIQLQETLLWGLGKVIALEHPESECRCLDLEPQSDITDSASILLEEILNCDSENQIAYHQGLRHVSRLVRQEKQREHKQDRLYIQSNGSYLITGGLGALGLEVAQWLVEQGARNIVLTSRREPSETAQKIIKKLAQKGAKISILLGDISQEQDVAKIIQEINSGLPPLKGLIHGAGIIDDCLLQQMSWKRFIEVIAPKVDGSWYLHKFTQDIPLDFFVCFSSIASVIGSPGQGNYVAANAFMDALAHHRHAMGLPGLSINWGPWAEAGMAVNLDIRHQNRMVAMGISPLALEQGLQILGQLLGQSLPQVGVFPMDWSVFQEKFSFGNQMPLLSELVEAKPTEKNQHKLLEQLESASEGDRKNILTTHIRTKLAQVLGMTASKIDVQQPLNTMGLDSLMAVELRNRLQTDLGVDVSIVKFIEGISIVDLTAEVNEQLTQIDRNQRVEQENNEQTLLTDVNNSDWIEVEL